MAKGDDNISKPRYKWWGYIKAVIRAYPDHCRDLKDAQEQSITANYSGFTGHSGVSKPVEQLALRQLPKNDQRELDAVQNAIVQTRQYPGGDLKVKLIEMVYFYKTHTLQGAADAIHIDYNTAKKWHRKFVILVAKYYGFFD